MQQSSSSQRSGPLFAFRDGVLTTSIQNGGVILLEDFDLPPQSVTERCNSLFEPDPDFYLAEDISREKVVNGKKVDARKIDVPPSFQVFATANLRPGGSINISPATRSRFTIVYAPAYVLEELNVVLVRTLMTRLGEATGESASHWERNATTIVQSLTKLHECVEHGPSSISSKLHLVGIVSMLKVCTFIASQFEYRHSEIGAGIDHWGLLEHLTLSGVRFLILDGFGVDMITVATDWLKACGTVTWSADGVALVFGTAFVGAGVETGNPEERWPEIFADPVGVPALGLAWTNVGSVIPDKGSELTNQPLMEALERGTTQFTRAELDGFNVRGFDADSFIKAGTYYYKPTSLEQIVLLAKRPRNAQDDQHVVSVYGGVVVKAQSEILRKRFGMRDVQPGDAINWTPALTMHATKSVVKNIARSKSKPRFQPPLRTRHPRLAKRLTSLALVSQFSLHSQRNRLCSYRGHLASGRRPLWRQRQQLLARESFVSISPPVRLRSNSSGPSCL